MNHLSLFSGIGGLDLGLDRAGLTTVGQVEKDVYCRSVLARHWPTVPQHDDVDTAVAWWREKERPTVDVVSGGFPCQPFSNAGHRQGTLDDRWKWPAMRAVIKEVAPRYVIGENVPGLLRDTEAFGQVIDDLSDIGYVVEWSIVSACSLGTPHPRRRLFIVAYPDSKHGKEGLGRNQHDSRTLLSDDGGQSCWDDEGVWLASARRADRVVNGLAGRMVAAGGNAVVPAVAEHIGRMLVDFHNRNNQEGVTE